MPLRSRNKRSVANRTKRHRKKLTSKRYRKLKCGGGGPKVVRKLKSLPLTSPSPSPTTKPTGKIIGKAASFGGTPTSINTPINTPKTTKSTGKGLKKENSLQNSAMPGANRALIKQLQKNKEKIDAAFTRKGFTPLPPTTRKSGLTRFKNAANEIIGQQRSRAVNALVNRPIRRNAFRDNNLESKSKLASMGLEIFSNRNGSMMLSKKKIDEMRKKQEFDTAFTKKLESALAKPKASTIRRANSSPTNVKHKPKPSKVQKANSFNNMTKKQQELEEIKNKLQMVGINVATNIMRASKELDDKSREKIAERFAQYLARNYGNINVKDIKVNKVVRDLNEKIKSVIEAMPTTKRSVRENTFESIMNLFK